MRPVHHATPQRGAASPLRHAIAAAPVQRPVAPQGPSVDPFDTSTDPALIRIRALLQSRQADAEASATQARNQLASDYGDPNLATDEVSRAAAASNPFSRSAALAKAKVERPRALDNSDSQQGLFYSSTHGQRQSDLAQSLLAEQAANNAGAQGALSQIEQGRLSSLSGLQDQLVQAEQDAANRRQAQLGDLPVLHEAPRPAPRPAPHPVPHPASPLRRALTPRRPR